MFYWIWIYIASGGFSALYPASRLRKEVLVRWFPPMDTWVKINTDGSFLAQSKIGACY